MTSQFVRDWYPGLVDAKNNASEIVWGEIYEEDAQSIIAEAAKLRAVEPPDPGSEEYRALVEEIKSLGESERDELNEAYRGTGDAI